MRAIRTVIGSHGRVKDFSEERNINTGNMADKAAMGQMYSSAFADNECAQALLELAGSSPINGLLKTGTESVSKDSHTGSVSFVDSSTDQRVNKTNENHCSILKRELEESDLKKTSPKSPIISDFKMCVKMECRSEEELRKELTKRICLDHNYIASNQAVLKGRRSCPEPKQSTVKSPTRGLHSWKSMESSRSNLHQADHIPVSSEPTRENTPSQEQRIPKAKPEKENMVANPLLPQQELYQPDDNKYKNLNLLLKCLKEDASIDKGPPSQREYNEFPKGTASYCSPSYNAECTDQLVNAALNTENAEYQCLFCPRVFQQKCYMSKHMKRVHATSLKEEQKKKADDVICPSCGLTVLWKDFKQHSHICNRHAKKSKKQLEMNLANCQFCGIRMRRHILVWHLAQEHCIENSHESNYLDFNDGVDSDSSTLSGSEHEVEDDDGNTAGVPSKDCLQPSKMDDMLWDSASDINQQELTTDVSGATPIQDLAEPNQPSYCKDPPPSTFTSTGLEPDSQTMLQQFLSDVSDKGQCSESTISLTQTDCHSCIGHMMLQGQNGADIRHGTNNNCPTALETHATDLPSASFSVCLSKESSIQNFIPAPHVLVAPSLRTSVIPNT